MSRSTEEAAAPASRHREGTRGLCLQWSQWRWELQYCQYFFVDSTRAVVYVSLKGAEEFKSKNIKCYQGYLKQVVPYTNSWSQREGIIRVFIFKSLPSSFWPAAILWQLFLNSKREEMVVCTTFSLYCIQNFTVFIQNNTISFTVLNC